MNANWLVGDRLADVLHVGDHELAHRLSDQGHEVVVVDEHARSRPDDAIGYVRGVLAQLPFIAQSFDAVVLPTLELSTVELAAVARVLRPGGHAATVSRSYDDTIPWVRRMLRIVGHTPTPEPSESALTRSGLFHPVEVKEAADWSELDLAATLQLARALGGARFDDDARDAVRALFAESAEQTGSLRLRHRTTYLRAQVDRSQIQDEEPAADTTLFDLR